MRESIEFLEEVFGLRVTGEPDEAFDIPLFLKSSAAFWRCETLGRSFVAVEPKGESSLPELKRFYSQTLRACGEPVTLVDSRLDARQCKSLVEQGIPFIRPEKQAFLPFLGFAAERIAQGSSPRPIGKGPRKGCAGRLSANAQAVLCRALADRVDFSAADAADVLRASPSTARRALAELEREGVVFRKGRKWALVDGAYSSGDWLSLHEGLLASPVMETVFVVKNLHIDALPDAGETALAKRSLLTAPRIAHKAIWVRDYRDGEIDFEETIEGALPDERTAALQVWSYDPLCAGRPEIDDVSLALSFDGVDDERISAEIDGLIKCEHGRW